MSPQVPGYSSIANTQGAFGETVQTPGTQDQDTLTPAAAGGTVDSVTAADNSIIVGGTLANPTLTTGRLDQIATLHPATGAVTINGQLLRNVANGILATDAATVGQIPTSLPPSGAAGGDLTLLYPNPEVAGIWGRAIASTAPSSGQGYVWNGTMWVPAGVLQAANNLSDVADAGSSRFHLAIPALSAVAAVATANVSLSAPGATLDGYALQSNDEVLLTAQSTPSQNGVWIWNGATSALTRPNEYPSGGVVKRGRILQVVNGTVYANTVWVLGSTATGLTIDSTAQTWVEARSTAAGLSLTRTAVQTANYTLNPSDLAPFDTTSGSLVAKLPNAPADQTSCAVKIVASYNPVNPLVAQTQGSDTFNTTTGGTSTTLRLLGQAALFVYQASTKVWTILVDDLPLGQLDLRFRDPGPYTFDSSFISAYSTTLTRAEGWAGIVAGMVVCSYDGAYSFTINHSGGYPAGTPVTSIAVTATAADIPSGTVLVMPNGDQVTVQTGFPGTTNVVEEGSTTIPIVSATPTGSGWANGAIANANCMVPMGASVVSVVGSVLTISQKVCGIGSAYATVAVHASSGDQPDSASPDINYFAITHAGAHISSQSTSGELENGWSWWSADGKDFHAMPQTQPVYVPQAGHWMRDPATIWVNGTIFMCYSDVTEPEDFAISGTPFPWGSGSSAHRAVGPGIAKSTDGGQTWTHVASLNWTGTTGDDGVTNIWGPRFFQYQGDYYIFIGGNNYFYVKCTDPVGFTTWDLTHATVVTLPSVTGQLAMEMKYDDTAGVWHAFSTGTYSGTYQMVHWTATSPAGPWTLQQAGFPEWESCTVHRLGRVPDLWRMYINQVFPGSPFVPPPGSSFDTENGYVETDNMSPASGGTPWFSPAGSGTGIGIPYPTTVDGVVQTYEFLTGYPSGPQVPGLEHGDVVGYGIIGSDDYNPGALAQLAVAAGVPATALPVWWAEPFPPTTQGKPGDLWVVTSGATQRTVGAGTILATVAYAPASLVTYTPSSTGLAAVDTTNATITFTVPANGIVDIEVQAIVFVVQANSSSTPNILSVCMFLHGTTTIIGYITRLASTDFAQATYIGPSRVKLHLTPSGPGGSHLVAGAALQLDLAAAFEPGSGSGGTVNEAFIYAKASTAWASDNTGPLVLQAVASV